jgi:hypothetical protein
MPGKGKQTYPAIPAKHWWTLRERFKQSLPTAVTAPYLAGALGMETKSAKTNIIPSLVMMGIIDEDGKPTDRAVKWRDDSEYREACREIRGEVYPQDLLDAFPGPSIDRPRLETWFARNMGVGEKAARRFALVYELLATARIPEQRKKAKTPAKPKAATKRSRSKSAPEETPATEGQKPPVSAGAGPSLHIDIQIHISPDAKEDQIDQIFASMAKHLKDLRAGND